MKLRIYGTFKEYDEATDRYEFEGEYEVTQEELVEGWKRTKVVAVAGNLRNGMKKDKLDEVAKKQGVTVGVYVPTTTATKKVDVSTLTVAELEELLARKVAEQAQ